MVSPGDQPQDRRPGRWWSRGACRRAAGWGRGSERRPEFALPYHGVALCACPLDNPHAGIRGFDRQRSNSSTTTLPANTRHVYGSQAIGIFTPRRKRALPVMGGHWCSAMVKTHAAATVGADVPSVSTTADGESHDVPESSVRRDGREKSRIPRHFCSNFTNGRRAYFDKMGPSPARTGGSACVAQRSQTDAVAATIRAPNNTRFALCWLIISISI